MVQQEYYVVWTWRLCLCGSLFCWVYVTKEYKLHFRTDDVKKENLDNGKQQVVYKDI